MERWRRWVNRPDFWPNGAILVWSVVVFVITIRVAVAQPWSHTVYPIYLHAANAWCTGANPYEPIPGHDVFRYPPTMAMAFVPWTWLPLKLGAILFRWLGVWLFLSGLAVFVRALLPMRLSPARQGVLYLLTLPLVLGSINNGQTNPHLIGLMLWGIAAVARQRWNLGALCFTVATLVKVYPIAVALLLCAAHPKRFLPRYFVGLLIGLALPWSVDGWQRGAYLYQQWWGWLTIDNRALADLERCSRDLYLILRVWWEAPTPRIYLTMQMLSALALAAVIVRMRWNETDARPRLRMTLLLGSAWITVLGPATESATYALVAPLFAIALAAAPKQRTPFAWGVAFVAAMLFATVLIAAMFPKDWMVQALGVQPIATLLLAAIVLAEVYEWPDMDAKLPVASSIQGPMRMHWPPKDRGMRESVGETSQWYCQR